MSSFIVSARKYRPETFKSVIGQDSITNTLKNAIKNKHLGHAYLFCGPRGIGKTTCARIFAKTINCYNLTPETEPCNICESCISFNESRSYNIHELDAASNNSVEDIRSLIEQVRIPPQIGKYSVYIIDEVHMLSQQAFNAFLKTLEEPPAHAVFILATTEKHKIIPTILSRCQIFDFNRIKVEDAVSYLKYIAEKEDIKYENEALHIIAQKSDGAMRDALSIFDQIVSFSGSDVKYKHVVENLNILDYDYYFKITDSFLSCSATQALLIFDEILNDGFDAHQFMLGLAMHLRDLLVAGNNETIKLLEVSDNIRTKYLQQSALCDADFLFDSLQICNEVDMNFKASKNQRLLIELALVRLSALREEKKKPESPGQDDPVVKKDKSQPEKDPPAHKNTDLSDELINSGNKEKPDRKNLVTNRSISIKNMVSGENQEETTETSQDIENTDTSDNETLMEENPFTSEDLKVKWEYFAEYIKTERPRLSIVLKNHPPVPDEGYQISLILDNSAQLEEFNKNVKNELTTFLRHELKNSYIFINSFIEKKENGKRMPYTTEERFQYLSNKNPALNKLKQQFNLDFE